MFLTTYIDHGVSGNDTKCPDLRGLLTHVLTLVYPGSRQAPPGRRLRGQYHHPERSLPRRDQPTSHPSGASCRGCIRPAPGLLDFYVWLVWKCWSTRQHSAHVPLFSDGGLVNQLGTDEYSSERFFRRKINSWLRQVKALWPECPAHVSSEGNHLRISPSKGISPVRPSFATIPALARSRTSQDPTLSHQAMI